MIALGYDKYVTQGGDWVRGFYFQSHLIIISLVMIIVLTCDQGFSISRTIGQLYPSHVAASHINIVPAYPPSPKSPLSLIKFLTKYLFSLYSKEEFDGLERTQWWQKKGSAYYEINTKNPQTIGYSLADSPVGLLGWIYEKLVLWTDEYEWSEEEVCTWISI